MTALHRILVVRNDKLGDFMLAWPALKTLRHASPDNHISVLVPEYTAAIARCCPWIDDVIIDPGKGNERLLQTRIRHGHFDAVMTLFSTPRIGWAVFKAGIPLRMAPATKWAQVFYNERITQRRSRSEKPEYIYNQDLATELAFHLNQHPIETLPPYWPFSDDDRQAQRQRLSGEISLDTSKPWWFLHPGSGGSAVNLSAQQYVELLHKVQMNNQPALKGEISWIVTWGPGEKDNATRIHAALDEAGVDAYLMPERKGLDDFAFTLTAGSGMVAGSTGPLHIAGCLDIATVGFYPSKRSATSLRWRTCNSAEKRLAFSPPASTDKAQATDMSLIDTKVAAQGMVELINRLCFT